MAFERREPTKAQLDHLCRLMAKPEIDIEWYSMEKIKKMTRSQVQQMIDRIIAETGEIEHDEII